MPDASSPKLLDQVRQAIRRKHYSIRTEDAYVNWIRRFILFHKAKQGFARHPAEMGIPEIESFLTDLAVNEKVAASTQNQALSALLFLYKEVLQIELDGKIQASRAKAPQHLPVVLSKAETHRLLAEMNGVHLLMSRILYGCGLRLMECVRLRVKDLDFELHQIVVRDGKGEKDRVTLLPESLTADLQRHLRHVKLIHEDDLHAGTPANQGRLELVPRVAAVQLYVFVSPHSTPASAEAVCLSISHDNFLLGIIIHGWRAVHNRRAHASTAVAPPRTRFPLSSNPSKTVWPLQCLRRGQCRDVPPHPCPIGSR